MAGQMIAARLGEKADAKTDLSAGAKVLLKKAPADPGLVATIVEAFVEGSKPLSVGSKGPAVEIAQKDLNTWRKANERKPIAENGKFDKETADAVKDFQKSNGLDHDGIVGPNSRDRLALENDPKFQALGKETKDQIREQMKKFEKDQTARNNLKELVDDPNFSKLSRAGQDYILQGLGNDGASAANLKTLKAEVKDRAALETNPNFKKLPEATQKQVLETMEKSAFEPGRREQLMRIATDPSLGKLSPAYQDQVLKLLAKHPEDASFVGDLKKTIGSESFQKMDDAMKTRTLGLLAKEPMNPRFNEQVSNLLSQKNFGALSAQQQAKALNIFEKTTVAGRNSFIELTARNVNGTPALTSKTIGGGQSTLLDQLDRFNSMALSPKVVKANGSPEDKGRMMQDLLSELANPGRYINQSNRGTCTCTSMTFNLAMSNPAEYARIVTDLGTNGVSMLAGGVMIAPPADGWTADGSRRSAGERLFQSALMNYGQGGKYQNTDPKNPNTDTGGLDLDQQINVLEALNGKSYKSVFNMPATMYPNPMMDQYDGFERTKSEIKAGRTPVYARLNWDGGGHAVEITKVENGRVYFRNPWGGNVPGVDSGVGTDYQRHKNPPRRTEDSANGIESMSEADYKMYLKSIIVES